MIDNIKALIVDIDGTLVVKGSIIMPQTRKAIDILQAEGVIMGLATGRLVDDYTRGYAKRWGLDWDFDVLIGANGGHLWDKWHPDEVEMFYPLSEADIKMIMDMVAPLNLNGQIYENSQLIAQRWDNLVAASSLRNMQEVVISPFPDRLYRRPNAKIQFRYEPDDAEHVLGFINALDLPDRIQHVVTYPGIVEFMDRRVDKGVALHRFAEKNNIPIENILTFGDAENDIALVREAGWGVVLANGSAETKAAGNDVTEYPVTEDGMGRYIFEKFLNPRGIYFE
ncbi:MAG: HAD family phosphatase [Solobacterium sp.]|nr:HAD family phosphatase [Solobacterium sp.]